MPPPPRVHIRQHGWLLKGLRRPFSISSASLPWPCQDNMQASAGFSLAVRCDFTVSERKSSAALKDALTKPRQGQGI